MADLGVQELVVWLLDEQRYALPLACVERVLPAIDVTPLPEAPRLVRGIVNVQGRIVPVVDMRQRFAHPPRELLLADQLLLVRSPRRRLGFFVSAVSGVVEAAGDALVPSRSIVPGTSGIAGVLKLPDGLILIHDLDRLLSLDDEQALDDALHQRADAA
ncbi:chemotaxis protein CheW [Aquabacterium sp.]|uniref:chemotaxis protein CheW n=1 Tax=Aquabacterium sp. TaxID=1872578 RepID=UPI002C0C1EED|nr:chemotaxis protein CheW [Aquabacterium sp.]HSW06798.1 chemotaxis protein CheW [Aquabacterium sp.]